MMGERHNDKRTEGIMTKETGEGKDRVTKERLTKNAGINV